MNLGIIGGVSYVAYENWDTQWDKWTVSAVTIGLLSLWAGEGYVILTDRISPFVDDPCSFLGEQYREKEYPKRR